MEREVEASLSVINTPWGDGISAKCLTETWNRTKLFGRAGLSDVQPILSVVNSKLSSQTEKLLGLQLLLNISKDCSDVILAESGASFIQQAARSCEKHNNVKTRCVALQIIKNLASRAEKFQNMVKAITGNALSQVVDCLNESMPMVKIHACYALYSILTHYSGSCGAVKANVEKRLVEILALNNENVCIAASYCFSRLSLIGGGGVAQQGHQAGFILLQKKTIGSLHLELDAFYEGVHELPVGLPVSKNEQLSLPVVKELKPTVRLQKLERRIRFLCTYLASLLVEPMTIPKGILVQDLLGLVCRALGVTGVSLGSSQLIEMQILRDLIPTVHSSFLRVLDSVISICGTNLLVHQETFFQIIKNTLAWTSSKKESENHNSFLRKSTYDTLTAWMMKMKGASCVEDAVDSLVPQIFQDITPEKDAVVLKAVKRPMKRKKGKAKEKVADVQADVVISKLFDPDLCDSALTALENIIRCASYLMKPAHYTMVQNHVVVLLVNLQRGLEQHPLYKSEKCQLRMYEILQSLVLFCHPRCPPPTVYAITLFSAGQMSNSREISRFCQQAIQVVQSITFPVFPPIFLDVEYSKTEEENDGEKMEDEAESEEESDVETEVAEEAVEEASDEIQPSQNGEDKQPSPETIDVEEQEQPIDVDDRPDSDLEVLEEIHTTTVRDLASPDQVERQELDDIDAEEKPDMSEGKSNDEDIELLDEQPAKKARQDDEGTEEVASMLADFVG